MKSHGTWNANHLFSAAQSVIQRSHSTKVLLLIGFIVALITIAIINWMYLTNAAASRNLEILRVDINASNVPPVSSLQKPVVFGQTNLRGVNDVVLSIEGNDLNARNSDGNKSSVTINGKSTKLSDTTNVHKQIQTSNKNGDTSVNISISSKSSNSADSSTSVNIESTSESEVIRE